MYYFYIFNIFIIRFTFYIYFYILIFSNDIITFGKINIDEQNAPKAIRLHILEVAPVGNIPNINVTIIKIEDDVIIVLIELL